MATRAHTEVRDDLADRIDAAAARMQRPRTEIVEEALASWLDTEDWKHQATLASIASGNAGNVVAHDRVVEWVRSLATANPLPRPQPFK